MGFGFFRSLSRAFGSERTEAVSRRGRQPRLAVIDAAKVDGRRHLVLIRRDNVEHLLMIGGPTDIVVEPAIVRAREPALARPPAFVETTQHPAAPAMSAPPPPHRQSATTEEPVSRDAKAEPPLPSAPRQPRPADQLAGLVAELSLRPATGSGARAARPRTLARATASRRRAAAKCSSRGSVHSQCRAQFCRGGSTAPRSSAAPPTAILTRTRSRGPASHRHRKAIRPAIGSCRRTRACAECSNSGAELACSEANYKLGREGMMPSPRTMANLLGGLTRADGGGITRLER